MEQGRGSRRRQLVAILFLAVVVVLGTYLRRQLDIEWDPEAIRELVEGFGFWAPLVFILLIAFRLVFLIPSQVILVAAGICFGFAEGTLYGSLGVTLSGLVAFTLARALGGGSMAERVPPRLRGLFESGGRRGGAILVILGTGYPFGPMTAFHVGAGLTSMTYRLFLFAVVIGAVLRSVLFTFLGSTLVERGLLGSWPALLPLGLVLLPLLHRRTREQVLGWLARE